MLISAFLLAVIRCFFFDASPSSLIVNEGKVTRFEGVVTKVKIKDYYIAFTVKTGREKVLVKVMDPEDGLRHTAYDYVGRKATVSGAISIPKGRRNPGAFDYRRYLKGKGIYTICTTNKYKIKAFEIKHPLRHGINVLKADFYDAADAFLSEEDFGTVAAILFGETSYMDDDYYDSFQKNGIAHILAVSGLHVNMTYDLVRKLFKKKKSKTIDLISVLLIGSYAVLSGFSLSVLRASGMIVLRIIAFHLDRRYDSISAISFIASLMLLINPYLIFDSGMQLSFTAAYTMAIFYPWLFQKISLLSDKTKSELFYKAGRAMAPGLAAFAGTAPLCAFHFSNFSLFSLLLNPIAIALAGVIVPAGLLGFALSAVLPQVLSEYAVYIDASILSLFLKALNFINNIGSVFTKNAAVTSPPAGLTIIYYILFFLLCSETRYILHRKNKYSELALLEASLLAAGVVLPFSLKVTGSIFPWEYAVSKVTFLDVGQGDCIHIHYGGKDILIDGGGSYYTNIAEDTLKPYLLKNGIKDIDLAIVTHEDMDHCKGIYELNEIFHIEKIVSNKDVYGDTGLDENDCCIVASMEIDGCSFLFMSDADIHREEYLLDAYPGLDCDVLKIAHHGSNNSTGESFLKGTAPSFAVFSVGEGNNYGHPAPRVIELLDTCGIIYARTDESGAICFNKADDKYLIFTNAAKDRIWRIQRQPLKNTLQGP
ncbi:MAG: ComEC/Rec2 family competence protein [Firmicutes bacterium]|nr:ComEC/Rec2 family competence protein [Bacillota bacterium]